MYSRYIKRIIDIIIALISMPFFFIIYILVALAIKIDDRGPVFYIDKRIGKGSKAINMYKFRSMKVNAPDIRNEDGSTFNSKNDPRLTRIGRFLRETSIDEIPQLINVLKGDMSIIGPRASMISVLDSYKDDEKSKMLVRPGISGYTQAYYRNGLSVREKRLKDSWYAENISFILDLKIFFKTIVTVIKKDGLYTNSDESKNIDSKIGV